MQVARKQYAQYNEIKRNRVECVLEVLLIGEYKMKIVLSERDVTELGLDISTPIKDTSLSRRAIWRILEKAGKMSGFDHTSDKMLIQIYPEKKGGCELFVTRLGLLSKESAGLVSSSKTVTVLSKDTVCYRFLGEQYMKDAIRAIKNHPSGVIPKGDAYKDSGGGYYLVIEEIGRCDNAPELPLVLEFGDRLTKDASVYVTEHFEKITDGDLIRYCSFN